MNKIRLFFYRAVLVTLSFHCYTIIEALYLDSLIDSSERGLVTSLIAMINMPLNLILALARLWTLKPIRHRHIYFEVAYFALPILTIISCFAGQIWGAIILSFAAGLLTLYEFLRNVLKKEFILFKRKRGQQIETI